MSIKAVSKAWIDAASDMTGQVVRTESKAKIEIANEIAGVRVRDDVHAEILIVQNLSGAVPLPPTSAIIEDGDSLVSGGDTYTFTVAGGVITDITVS